MDLLLVVDGVSQALACSGETRGLTDLVAG